MKLKPAKKLKNREHKRLKMHERERRMSALMNELRERAAPPLGEEEAQHLKSIATE